MPYPMKKKRAKPTIKDVAQHALRIQEVQGEMIDWINNIQRKLELVDNTLGAYILMEGASDKLSGYIEKEIEKKKKEKGKGEDYISPNDPGDENDAS
tara:strand:- start:298 stop:588 length:291 start_codon:yes stop_codon:yes gene_type:complete